MSDAWYWPGLGCSDPPEESCSDAACPVHASDHADDPDFEDDE